MNLFDLTGKSAIVTGGTNGLLGPIWLKTLKEAGATVTSLDLPDFDVTTGNIRKACSWLDRVDILVNNAGIDNPPTSKASFFGNFARIMEVNITGAARMAEQVIPGMIRDGGGVIVNIGSIMGNIGANPANYPEGFEKPAGYNCSKAAMVQLSRSICTQYGRHGIRSVTISFGPYAGARSPKAFLERFLSGVPLGCRVSKHSLSATLLYACCCPELSGTQIIVDGGYTAL